VERNHACAFDPVQKKSDIARTIDDFRILTNKIGVNIRYQLPAAISATGAKYRVDIRTFEHLQELIEAPLARAGKVTV